MKITIITLFPEMLRSFFDESIIKRAQDKGVVDIDLVNLRDFAIDSYGSVDDRSYGGGAGMVLRIEPLAKAINKINDDINKGSTNSPHFVLTSPRGNTFNQSKAQEFSKLKHLVLIAGHYEGVDDRIFDYINEEVSIGDFVITGGEIGVSAIVDAVVRLLPGTLVKDEATKEESFMKVKIDELIGAVGETDLLIGLKKRGKKEVMILEYPHFTRPEIFEGKKVPEILLSGDPKKIRIWRLQQAYKETVKRRKDLLTIF